MYIKAVIRAAGIAALLGCAAVSPIWAQLRVLSVQAGDAGDAAGIKRGDVLMRWSKGATQDVLVWPDDLADLFAERWHGGAITIFGARNGAEMSWNVGNRLIGVRPYGLSVEALSPEIKPALDRIQELIGGKRFSEAAEFAQKQAAEAKIEDGARYQILCQTATLLANNGRLADATPLLRSAAASAIPSSQPYLLARLYRTWSDFCGMVEDTECAIERSSESIELWRARAPERPLYLAATLRDLADYQSRISEFDKAIKTAQEAVAVAVQAAPHSEIAANTIQTLGAIYMEAGQYPMAQKTLELGLETIQDLKSKSEARAYLYATLGGMAHDQGDLDKSEAYVLRCLAELKEIPDQEQFIAVNWLNLGTTAFERINFPRAEFYYQRALEVFKKAGVPGERDLAQALTLMGVTKAQSFDLKAAEPYLRQAIELHKRVDPRSQHFVDCLLSYGQLLTKENRLLEAHAVFERAVSLALSIGAETPITAQAHTMLGFNSWGLHKLAQAERECSQALAITRNISPDSIAEAGNLVCLAQVERSLRQRQAAARHYAQAEAMIDRKRLATGLPDQLRSQDYYLDLLGDHYTGLLIETGQLIRGFETLDRWRAQTLGARLGEDYGAVRKTAPAALLEESRTLDSRLSDLKEQRMQLMGQPGSKRLAALDAQITTLNADREMLENRIRAANPRLNALTSRRRISLAEIQRQLEPETALLEYSLIEGRSYVIAVDRNRIEYRRLLLASNKVDDLAKEVYRKWSTPSGSVAPLAERAAALSQTVLSPVAEFIRPKRRLLIVPSGALAYIPFGALPNPNAAGAPLAAHYEIVNLPSAALLKLLREQPRVHTQGAYTTAVLGDPVFSKDDPRVAERAASRKEPIYTASRGAEEESDFANALESADNESRGMKLTRLIHSREEAEAIAAVAPKGRTFVALDFDANRNAALRSEVTNARIVHFATHGIFDAKNPAMSGLIFSTVDKSGKPQAGFLGMDAIAGAHFSADLVVLSACETALGEQMNGEGLVGLTWGFIYAGARSVVASLWRVNDASTAELMRLFYEGMERRGLTAAAALHEAQLAISQKPQWASPYYWAGFVLEGDYGK